MSLGTCGEGYSTHLVVLVFAKENSPSVVTRCVKLFSIGTNRFVLTVGTFESYGAILPAAWHGCIVLPMMVRGGKSTCVGKVEVGVCTCVGVCINPTQLDATESDQIRSDLILSYLIVSIPRVALFSSLQ